MPGALTIRHLVGDLQWLESPLPPVRELVRLGKVVGVVASTVADFEEDAVKHLTQQAGT